MQTLTRLLVVGAVLALGGWFLADNSAADDKDGPRDAVRKLAGLIQKKDMAAANKQAESIAKATDLEDLMMLFRPRVKQGPQGGIEKKLLAMSRTPLLQGQLDKEAEGLQQMAYTMAAIAAVARAKVPDKDEGTKTRKDWIKWSEALEKAAVDLAGAARAKDSAGVRAAVTKVQANCNNCHTIFRD